MRFRKSAVKYISLLLMLALVMSTVLAIADGEDDTGGEAEVIRPRIYVDYLGISTNHHGPGAKSAPPTLENPDVIFWVGVGVDKLSEIEFIKNGGLYSVEIGIDYNPSWVEPWSDLDDGALPNGITNAALDEPSAPETSKKAAWLATLNYFNLMSSSDTGYDEATYWDSSLYEIDASSSARVTGVDQDYYREEIPKESWKMAFVSLSKKSASAGAATNRFYNTDSSDTKYLLKIPFRLKQVPTDGSKPLVFKLSRGPSTLGMTSGADGADDFAQWEKQDRSEPKHNLKTLFEFAGDLNIFGGSSETGITEMTAASVELDGDNETVTNRSMYTTNDLSVETAFVPDRTDYYIRVPASADKLRLTMVGSTEAPTVEYSDYKSSTTPLTPTTKDGAFIADITLADVDMSVNNGFNNSVTIKSGDKTYIVYVQKLVQPKITLNYGNSPYAEIEKMGLKEEDAWSAEDIATAKTTFDETRKYHATLIPDGRSADDRYTLNAWVNPNNADAVAVPAGTDLEAWALKEENAGKTPYVDYDKDVNAMFAYLGTDTPDPGFTVTDSLGNAVTLAAGDEGTEDGKVSVARTISYDVMNKGGIAGFTDVTSVADTAEDNKLNADITDPADALAFKTLGLRLRPGRYTIKYSFTDSYGGTVAVERTLIFLARLGDVDMNTLVQTADSALINKNTTTPVPNENMQGLEVQGRIHKYRVSDADKNTLIQTADAALINKNTTKAIKLLYNDLSGTYN